MRIKPGPASITLGGFDMAYLDTTSGASVIVETVEGWFDLPEVRSGISDRPATNGGFDGKPWYSPRVITLSGTLSGTTQGDAFAARDTLAGLLFSGDLLTLTIDHEEVGERSTSVRPSAGAGFQLLGGSSSMSFSVTVTAPDPLKYGAQVFGSVGLSGQVGTGRAWPRVWPTDWGVPAGQSPGSVSLANAGNATYWPRLRIDGPVPNPKVTLIETGDWIRYDGTLSAGQWLDFDLASRRVLLNGGASVRNVVSHSGSWLGVPPGGGSVSWTADAADPAARLSVWSYEGAWS